MPATVRLPPLEELALRWAEIEPLLRKATVRTGCYEPVDLLQMALMGRAGIWIAERDGEILVAIVTEVKQYPRRRVLEVMFGGGSDMGEWIKPMVAALDEHAKAAGCAQVATAGRPGWARVWGARATGDVILARDL